MSYLPFSLFTLRLKLFSVGFGGGFNNNGDPLMVIELCYPCVVSCLHPLFVLTPRPTTLDRIVRPSRVRIIRSPTLGVLCTCYSGSLCRQSLICLVLDSAASVTFGTFYLNNTSWSWRLPALIQVAPTCVQLCLVMVGPESPRWLMSKGK